MKNHVYSFSRFNRIYEMFDPEEESKLDTLYKESSEAFMAALNAGTADAQTFLNWMDAVCDVIDNTQTKGFVYKKMQTFLIDNTKKLIPIYRELAKYSPTSPMGRASAKAKKRLYDAARSDVSKRSRAEDLKKKYGL